MKVLFATGNATKAQRFSKGLLKKGIEVVTLKDMNIELDVEENGKDAIENALIKARAYSKEVDMPVFAMDDTLYLENVPDEIQPGTHVRRVNGKRLNDEEMIDYYKSLVKRYGTNNLLKGYFLKAVALIYKDEVYTYEIKVHRVFTSTSSNVIREGYPLASIQIVSAFNKYKSELTDEESAQEKREEQKELIKFVLEKIKELENTKVLKK